ncbi:MAG: FAD-dependent oxidoreductase [Hyphomicrobiaceae bacterium]
MMGTALPPQCDVLVVGSGAAGLTAALTAAQGGAKVIVLEKEPVIGGTTALSEGMIWVPLSRQARKAGLADTAEAATSYIEAAAGRHFNRGKAEAYVRNAAPMLDFIETRTSACFTLARYSPDYHQELVGATVGMRAFNPGLFDGRRLGADFARLRPPLATTMILGGMTVASADLPHFMNLRRSPRAAWHAARVTGRYALDRLTGYCRGTRLANGNGLIGALMLALVKCGVPILTQARAVKLSAEDGRVTGAHVAFGGALRTIAATKGVVLAAGGFPGDPELQRQRYRHVAESKPHYSLAPRTNTGDGLRLAIEHGAVLDEDVSQPAAWTPVSLVPMRDGTHVPFPHYIDRGKPGVIAVDTRGRRFTNEGQPYHRFVPAMIEACAADPEVVIFLIADRRALRAYGLGAVPPAPARIAPFRRSGYLIEAANPAALGQQLGIDGMALAQTIENFNASAMRGKDPQFGKGSSAFDRAYGDPAWTPNPCVGPLTTPPFYAVRVMPGDIATFVGLATDAAARVLDARRRPIPGLYAAGNDMTSPFGGDYCAAGITIGAAMTFGYVAGRTLAGAAA